VHTCIRHVEVDAQPVQRLVGTFMVAPVHVCQEVGQHWGLRWHKHLATRHDHAVDDPPLFSFLIIEHLFHHSLEGRVSSMLVTEFVKEGETSRYDMATTFAVVSVSQRDKASATTFPTPGQNSTRK
jgi:hypothetical protein